MSFAFDSQIKHYTEKFYSTKSKISSDAIRAKAKGMGVDDEFLKEGLLSNSEAFRKFVFTYAATLMPGRVSCTTYAAVVAVIAEMFGVEYETKSGLCLLKSSPSYQKNLKSFHERKTQTGDEHPLYATHVYLVINDKSYEYFNGDTSNIDHVDVVTI